jgi:hypothetical protein
MPSASPVWATNWVVGKIGCCVCAVAAASSIGEINKETRTDRKLPEIFNPGFADMEPALQALTVVLGIASRVYQMRVTTLEKFNCAEVTRECYPAFITQVAVTQLT